MYLLFFCLLIYNICDPLLCSLMFLFTIIFFSFFLIYNYSFWVSYFLVLLFISGVLIILVFFSALSNSSHSYNSAFFFFIFLISYNILNLSFLLSYPFFFNLTNLLYFILIILTFYLFIFLFFILVNNSGSLRIISVYFNNNICFQNISYTHILLWLLF